MEELTTPGYYTDPPLPPTNASLLSDEEATEAPIVYPRSAIVAALVFCILFVFLGVLGNLLTILSLLRSRKLRLAPTTVFVISLCATDLIFCGFNLPLTAMRYAKQRWVLGETLCRLFPFFFYLNVAASLFHLVVITFNRYILVAHHMSYARIYGPSNVALMIAGCWGIPLALLAPIMAESWGRFGYAAHTFSCTILRDANGRSPKKFLFLLGFFLPIVVILICYVFIFRIVCQSRKAMHFHHRQSLNASGLQDQSQRKTSKSGGVSKQEMALTRMVGVIFTLFLLSYLPLMFFNVFDDDNNFPSGHVAASILAWSASVINPWVYGFMSPKYRQAYMEVFRCFRFRKDFQVSTGLSSGGTGVLRNSLSGSAFPNTTVKLIDTAPPQEMSLMSP